MILKSVFSDIRQVKEHYKLYYDVQYNENWTNFKAM